MHAGRSISSNSRSSLGWKSANDDLHATSFRDGEESLGGKDGDNDDNDEKSNGDKGVDNDDSRSLSDGPDPEQESRAATGTMHTSDFVEVPRAAMAETSVEDVSQAVEDEVAVGNASAGSATGKARGEDENKLTELVSSPAANNNVRWESGEQGSRMEGASTPRASRPDQERMKAYLINSVKALNPLREAHLRNLTPRRRVGDASLGRTPMPGPSRLRLGDEVSDENGGDSFVSDASSTRDLTVPARLAMRANTSFPGVGASDGVAASSGRVDPSRLQGYLHKINIQLESENLSLKEEKEALTRQFNRALMDCERLKRQSERDGLRHSSHLSKGTMTSNDEVQELKREIEIFRTGQEELNDMLDEREAELASAEQRLRDGSDPRLSERLRDLEEELAEEREASQQQQRRFEEKITAAMQQVDQVQRAAEERLLAERDEAWGELEKTKLTTARTSESTGQEAADGSTAYRDREQHFQNTLRHAEEIQAELELRVEGDAAALDELEAELIQAKQELAEARDQVIDLQIAAEEKENDNIKLTMQLRQARDSSEVRQLREKVVLLEAQLEGERQDGVRELTPIHKSIAILRKPVDTPKSPAELSSASWLNNESSLGDKSVLRNIHELRGRVDDAHAQTDEKLAALGTGQLAHRLVEMQDHITAANEEVRTLQEREVRWKRRIERIRCGHCKTRLGGVDLGQSIASISVTTEGGDTSILAKSTRSGHQKEQIVADIAEQLNELKARWAVDRARLDSDREAMDAKKKQWTEERAQLQTENQRLRRDREKQNKEARENARRMQEGTLKDLSRARRIIGEFERELKDDCARFQHAMQSSRGLDKDGIEVERELARTKSKLHDVEGELKAKVEVFERLESELVEKSQMDQSLPLHVQLLELEVRKFSIEVESLRNERNAILEQRQALYHRHRHNQEEYMNMFEELKSAREAISAHQVQLDEQIETIEKLHGTLTAQNKDLEALHDDRDRLQSQRKDILTDVASLETDLRRVREESRRFGHDLEQLRTQQEWTKKEVPPIVDAGGGSTKTTQMRAAMQEADKKHRAQCQGLLLQVRYEKAKFMRESDLRSDLIQQKAYLLGILGGMDILDATTSQFLAKIRRRHHASEVPCPASAGVSRFRVVARAVVGVCRAR